MIVGDEHGDSGPFCILFRCFLRRRLHRLFRLRRRFLFGCHDTDSPLNGNTTVIFVPLPRELLIFNSPPICSTRSRIPTRPTPSFRSSTLKPSPSSSSSKCIFSDLQERLALKLRARAYLRVLLKASCPMWRRFSCQG